MNRPTEFNFRMKKFDISRLKPNHIITIIGQAKSGKTTLVNHIFSNIKEGITNAFCMSNDKQNYKGIVYEPSYDNIHNLMRHVTNKKKKIENYSPLQIIDGDLEEDWYKNIYVKYMFMNAKKLGLTLIYTLENSLKISPVLRNECDFVFIFREERKEKRKQIYSNYAGLFPTFEMFCDFMDRCNDFECLVIDITTNRSEFEYMVYWYKCEPIQNEKDNVTDITDELSN